MAVIRADPRKYFTLAIVYDRPSVNFYGKDPASCA